MSETEISVPPDLYAEILNGHPVRIERANAYRGEALSGREARFLMAEEIDGKPTRRWVAFVAAGSVVRSDVDIDPDSISIVYRLAYILARSDPAPLGVKA